MFHFIIPYSTFFKVQTFVDKCIAYSKRLPIEVTNNSPEFADPILFKIMCDTFIRHKYFFI